MTLLAGSLMVSTTIQPNHPSLRPGNDWFGNLEKNQGFSLNGGKVTGYYVAHKPILQSKEVIDRRIAHMGNHYYWSEHEHNGVNEYCIYLSMASPECVNKAFDGQQYELAPGVLLCLSTRFFRDINDFKQVSPWTPNS